MSQPDVPPVLSSYPSFWDAIPVDPPPAVRPVREAVEPTAAVLTVDRLEVD